MQTDDLIIINCILEEYQRYWLADSAARVSEPAEETSNLLKFRRFIAQTKKPFARQTLQGHITGSAMVLSPEGDRILLMHHKKLNKWLQLGGHSDGDSNPARVALREAHEESGLSDLSLMRWNRPAHQDLVYLPFDLDVHDIPARKAEPAHQHFDVRYLVQATQSTQIKANEESHELRWVSLEQAQLLTQERSMLRQFDKLSYLMLHGLHG